MNDRRRASGTEPGLPTSPPGAPFLGARMLIASWNVNSIRARLDRVKAWLEATRPDVLCLQELKVEDKGLPAFDGYHCVAACQKTYNGVAILSKTPITDVVRGDGIDDGQERLIGGTVGGLRIWSV